MSKIWWSNDNYISFNKEHPVDVIDKIIDSKQALVSTGPYNNVVRYAHNDKIYFVKRYHKAGSSWIRKLTRSRVRNEWENLVYFHRLGIRTPNIVAYGECKKFGMYDKGYLITENVDNAKDIEAIAKDNMPQFRSRQWRLQVIEQVAAYTGILHEEGFSHNDLKWRNILATLDDEPLVYFFDCPLGRHRVMRSGQRGYMKDLATLEKWAMLYLSKTDRLRFYLQYRNIKKLTQGDKLYIKKINQFFSEK